jgi:PAS domain-containing protein
MTTPCAHTVWVVCLTIATAMSGALTLFSTELDWRLIALAAACLAAALLLLVSYYRTRRQNARLVTALDNMSEGVCMFDASTRLILCNGRYIEMYGLTPEVAKPGALLREPARAPHPRRRLRRRPR